jgi:hypothetical protein
MHGANERAVWHTRRGRPRRPSPHQPNLCVRLESSRVDLVVLLIVIFAMIFKPGL